MGPNNELVCSYNLTFWVQQVVERLLASLAERRTYIYQQSHFSSPVFFLKTKKVDFVAKYPFIISISYLFLF